ARIVRSATQEVSVRGYVEAAVARGERTAAVLRREILPNILGAGLADGGVRLAASSRILASVNLVGRGLHPPAAHWAVAIRGLVGESGSGKTTTALALLGYTRPGVRVVGGTISVAGQAVTGRRESAVRTLRGRLVSYVPQDPASALNPSVRVGDQIGHMVRTHAPERDVDTEVTRALELVQLPTSTTFRRRFPHQLSGGQQQRVAIAAALVCRPSVAVLDEPTTGLDVVTQSRLLAELEPLRRELKLAIVYVSHDLAVVASIADEIAVMYAGRVVEQGPAATVLRAPRHPYTRGLLTSVPDPHEPRHLRSIPGVAVGVGERPAGCAFAPRCPQR